MGIKSIFVIFKFSWWKLTLFSGWNARFHAIGYYYNEHTVAFYAIIIIILLIVVYVIYLESNPEEDYLIRPYKILLGISLIVIVIYIIASAPKQNNQLEMFDYSDTPKLTKDMLKYPYEDEKKWIKEGISCQSLEDETEIKYCLETKKVCSEFIDEKVLKMKPFSTCVSKVRERLGMHPVINDQFYNPTKTVEREDGKINWSALYDEPFSNFEAIEKRWGTMSSEQKLQTVRNVFQTGTTYDQFPDWMKNDPVILEIKEELQQINSND